MPKSSEVAVVDTSITGYEEIVNNLAPDVEVILINNNGIAELVTALQDYSDLDALHIFSHGSEGKIAVGGTLLSNDNLDDYQQELATIGATLSSDGDILLYGCNVASGSGYEFVHNLGRLTGADIAASNDLTGSAKYGGDWDLEEQIGSINYSYSFDQYQGFLALPISGDQTTNYDGLGYADTAVIPNSTAIDDISYDGWRFNGFGGETGIYPHEGSLTASVGTTGTRFYTSDGTSFKFTGIDYVIDTAGSPATASITFYGFVDGGQVESQSFNAADTSSGTWTLNWGSVDEVKIAANTQWIFMDNLQVGTEIPSNTTPTISIDNSNLAYTENGAATQIDAAGTVSDADGDAEWNGGTLEVQITGNAEAGDRITLVDSDGDGTAITISGNNILSNGTDIGDLSVSGGSVTGGTKLTITFDSDATNSNVQEVLQSIRYDSTSENPGTSNRTVTFTATDSSAAGASDTRTIVITAVNDEPTLTATGSNPTFTEGGAAASLFSGSSVSTVESGQTISGLTLTVTNITNGSNERLNLDGTTVVLTHGTNGTTATNSLNYSVSVIGTTATVSLTGGTLSSAAMQTLVDNASYQNNSNAPSTSNRVVTLTSVQDSGGTANGGDNTGSLAIASTVTVTSVNDEPTLTATGSNPTFTEGGSAASLFSGSSVGTVESGQTLSALTLTVTNVNDGSNERLNLDGTAIILTHGTSGTTATNSLSYSVSVSGTTATVSLTGGTLSTAATQTLVNAISYQNNSGDPNTSNRVITLTSLQDSGGTANGGDDTAALAVASTVTVVGVNDEPTVTATGSNPTFTEGGSAASLFSGSSVSTIESGQTISGLTLTVTNVNDGSNERLNLDGTTIVLTHGTSGTTATNSLSYSVSVVGTTATVSLTGGTLSTAATQTLVNAISYQNNAGDPNTSNRVVTLTSVQDSGGTANGGDNTGSLAIASTVTVTSVNDEPTLTATGSNPAFTEGGSAASLFSGSSVSTVESGQTLSALTLTVTNVNDGSDEILNVDGTAVVLTNGTSGTTATNSLSYSVSVSGTTATVSLTGGTLSTAATQTLVNAISYQNNSSSPNTSNRVITLTSLQDSGGTANGGDDTAALAVASTVSIVELPSITSATYDYSTNQMTVTGTGFAANAGAANDVDLSDLTITGEGGSTFTLTTATDVERTSATEFSFTLSGADLVNVEGLLNKNGLVSDNGTTYNLAAADDFITAITAGDSSDTTGNGITVSNYAVPTLTSASYDWSTGQLVLTGTNFVPQSGASNDVDASLLTFTGDGGATYTLTDSADVEITSATAATLTLSVTDQLHIHGLLNKNGTSSDDSTTYNLAAAEDWITGAPSANTVADLTGNGITVSNVAAPTVTSASYDSDTGVLTVTGTNLFKNDGVNNDIDISTLTLTGGTGNATYTLTSASDVEITSATAFSVTLAGADKTNVDALLDQLGTSSSGGSTYNIAVADNWLTAALSALDIADGTNAVTVTISPKITSSTYDASTGVLVVTGTNIQANGGGSDIDASLFTLTGEGGATYTLTDTADVERDSATQFTLTLSATDKAAVNQIINKDGTASTGATTYNLAAADDWDTNVTSGDTADTTANGVTVSNVAAPTLTSSTYDANTGVLVVTGTNLLNASGAANDIDVSLLSFTGEGGSTYTLTDSSDVDITSGSAFTVTLSATDKAAISQMINKNGTTSTGGTTYNLAAAEDWAVGADAAVTVVDASGNGITVSNVPVPTITSSTYDFSTGTLVVTGTGFLQLTGAANDIDVSLLTLTGEGGATHTLTSATDVEISSATSFSVVLAGADKTAVDALINKNGTSSTDGTTYNLAAAEDWAAGADAAVNVVDATGNSITASVNLDPVINSDGGLSTAALSVTENQTAVTTVSATDPDGGDPQIYSISGGADAARFDIDANSGVLTFASAPNFEQPNDADTDNDYLVEVSVSDGNGGSDTQTLTVSVTDVNDAPTLTTSTSLSVAEGNLPITTLEASDDEDNPITFALAGGADASLFTINVTSGALNFSARPNFEQPTDSGNNNSYVVNISVTDSIGASSQETFTVTVTDVEEAPVLAEQSFSVLEGNSDVGTLLATDSDQGASLSYSLGGTDASLFTLNSQSGELDFIQAPSFSTPLDQDGDNRYEVTVTATDNTNLSTQANVFVQVRNQNDAPEMSPQSFTVAENTTSVGTVQATDDDPGEVLSYELTGGADQSLFSINAATGQLSLQSAGNFENPNDSNGDGQYDLTVRVTDSLGAQDSATITVELTDAPDTPTFTSASTLEMVENTTLVGTLTATDEDQNPTLSYGLLDSGDSALFTLNSQTGQLRFISAPDFETPNDADADNHYALQVTATDETGLSTTQALTVTLTNEVEAGDDTDNDGIPDTEEGNGTVDTDNDGLTDNEDPDSDNDGQDDATEVNRDTDNDGIDDNLDPDDDNDSIDSAVEAQVPTLTTGGLVGDGNGDGVADTRQNSVSSTALVLVDETDDNGDPVISFVTLVTDSQEGKAATEDSTSRLNEFTQQDLPDDAPADIEMPFGLISFVSEAEEQGATETFSLYLDADIAVNGYWKQNSLGDWVNIATAIVAEGNKTRIDFEITDGGEFDEDGEANGTIVDPGAPGLMSTVSCEWDLFRDDADGDAMPDTIETLLGYDSAVKDNDVFSIDELWIRQISRDLIGEEINDQELSDWSAGLDAGMSKQEMLESFTQTERYDATSTLVRLYHAVLDRSPEQCGFDYWQQQLNNGLSTLELSANMLASAEFLTDHASLEDSDYLDLLYNNILDRAADTSGHAFWLNSLEQGDHSREQVLLEFVNSTESRDLTEQAVAVDLLYLGLLDRDPEAAGLAYWLSQAGAQDSVVDLWTRATTATSEYHDRFLNAGDEPVLLGVTNSSNPQAMDLLAIG